MISAFGVEHIEKASAADRQANDAARAARGGIVPPSGAPSKYAARTEDTRAAARLKPPTAAKAKPTGLLARVASR